MGGNRYAFLHYSTIHTPSALNAIMENPGGAARQGKTRAAPLRCCRQPRSRMSGVNGAPMSLCRVHEKCYENLPVHSS